MGKLDVDNKFRRYFILVSRTNLTSLLYYFQESHWSIASRAHWLENFRLEDKCSFITARLDKCCIGSQSGGFQRNFTEFMDLPCKIAIYRGLTWHVVAANIKHQTGQNNINYNAFTSLRYYRSDENFWRRESKLRERQTKCKS